LFSVVTQLEKFLDARRSLLRRRRLRIGHTGTEGNHTKAEYCPAQPHESSSPSPLHYTSWNLEVANNNPNASGRRQLVLADKVSRSRARARKPCPVAAFCYG